MFMLDDSNGFMVTNGNLTKTDNGLHRPAPNPTKSIVNVSCKYNVRSLQLFDLNGRLLKTQESSGTQSGINISDHAKGIYLLKVTTEYGSKSEKIVKE